MDAFRGLPTCNCTTNVRAMCAGVKHRRGRDSSSKRVNDHKLGDASAECGVVAKDASVQYSYVYPCSTALVPSLGNTQLLQAPGVTETHFIASQFIIGDCFGLDELNP